MLTFLRFPHPFPCRNLAVRSPVSHCQERAPTAICAFALPAARDGAGRLATSCLTSPARGTWSQAADPATHQRGCPGTKRVRERGRSLVLVRWSYQCADVAPRHARLKMTAATCWERRRVQAVLRAGGTHLLDAQGHVHTPASNCTDGSGAGERDEEVQFAVG